MKHNVPEITSLFAAVFSYLDKLLLYNLIPHYNQFYLVFYTLISICNNSYLALVQGRDCHLDGLSCCFNSHFHSFAGVSAIVNILARDIGATRLLSLL